MAPVEIEYGRYLAEQNLFVHDDLIEPVIIDADDEEKRSYTYGELKLFLEGKCDTQDRGGFVKYKFQKLGLIVNSTLDEGTLSLSCGQEEIKTETHRKNAGLSIGFKVKHVAP